MEPQQFLQWLREPAGNRRPLVMGVLNVTPDSFSDAGLHHAPDAACAAAQAMVEAGADLIDVGGESTRPGSQPVSETEQIARVVPVVRAIRAAGLPVTISIDTTRAGIASAALDAGADLVNDISAGRDDAALLPLCASRNTPVVLMHMQGTPATMQQDPHYSDVIAEVIRFLRNRADAAMAAGIPEWHVMVDPGIGFGKTLEHNLQLLKDTAEIVRQTGLPVLVGSSRKGFIGKITNEPDASRRQFGTAATVAWAVSQGSSIVRVHDVGPMVQVVRMMRAIASGRLIEP